MIIKITGTVLLAPFGDPNNPFEEIENSKNKYNIGMNLRLGKSQQEVCIILIKLNIDVFFHWQTGL